MKKLYLIFVLLVCSMFFLTGMSEAIPGGRSHKSASPTLKTKKAKKNFRIKEIGKTIRRVQDLTIAITRCPKTASPGQELRKTFTVTGKSTFSSILKNIAVDIILKSNNTYPSPVPYALYSPNYSDSVLLKGGREHISFNGPGSINVKLNGSNTIPSDTPPGTYYLGAVIDAGNKVQESNERNNVALCRIQIQRKLTPPSPSLNVTASPASASNCSHFTATVTGFNPTCMLQFYINGTYVWDAPFASDPAIHPFKNMSTFACSYAHPGVNTLEVRTKTPCGSPPDTASTTFNITAPPPPPCPALNITIWPTQFFAGTRGQAYENQLQSSGGQAPVTFSLVSGSLPPRLSLNESGLISGTPTTAGSYNFTVKATDRCSSVQKAFSMDIAVPLSCILPHFTISSPLASGTEGQAYSKQIQASGGEGSITYSLTGGTTLPPKLSINGSGLISGTPVTAGSYSFTIRASSHCFNSPASIRKSFTININPSGWGP